MSGTAEETGSPVLAMLVLLIVRSYRDVGGEPERASVRDHGQALSRLCLRFILMLWSEHPAVQEHYRQSVPDGVSGDSYSLERTPRTGR